MELQKIELADFGNLFRTDPAKLADQELLSLDYLLHRAWKHKREGGQVHFGDKYWSFEDLVNLHALVRREMSSRAFQHTAADELDSQTQPFLKAKDDLAPVHPSGVELGREITLEEVLPQIKSFYAHPVFAWIVGGLANWGKTKGDIDVLWWATPDVPEYLKKILEFRFGRQFADKELAGRVQHHLNYYQGPFTKAVPIYALKVERINPEGGVKEASAQEIGFKPEPVDLVWDEARKGWTIPDCPKQLRSASEDVQAQAEASAKEDEVRLFRFFYPLKPTRGHKPDEPQSVDAFLRAFKDEDFPVYSSKKFDGADYVVFRDGDRVRMISEDGRDNTDRFPEIAEALKSLPVPRFALLAEIERWDEDKHLPRETVTAYVNAADEPDDSDFIANVYDAVYFESENVRPGDIHKLPFADRLRFLEALGLPQSTDDPPDLDLKLNLVPHYRCRDKDELREKTEKLRRLEGSEGNVAKAHGFVYNLENKPSGMVKFHNAAILRGVVTESKETKTPEVFNFSYGLDFQGMKVPNETIRSVGGRLFHEIGTTFSSTLAADPSDVIEVEFETLNVTRDLKAGTVAVSAWAPRVLGIAGKGRPMTIGEAVKAAREGFVLQEKELTPEGETLYKGVRQAFGSYGGKRFLAHRIASYIPLHKTYVEPFAGGAAVFFAKDPSPKEVLNDRDAEIAFMYRFIRDHAPEDRQALAKRDWVIRKETHERLKTMKPATDRDRFYKAFYLTRSSYGKQRGGSFNPANAGVRIDFPANIERAQKRLQNAAVRNKD
ncbi:MAG: DNA adenine methylase, partial [Elusimicrobia bacterium]|nr:DNA adenine methylase [Elusimicrobiota bacterium]